MNAREILEKVKTGEWSVEKAEGYFRRASFEDLGYAKLDTHRKVRSGFAEVVFCSGKADDHLVKIYQTFADKNIDVMGTRATQRQYELVKEQVLDAVYDPLSRILKVERQKKEGIGCVAVCTGGIVTPGDEIVVLEEPDDETH